MSENYLRGVIRDIPSNFDLNKIKSLNETDINDVLNGVEEAVLNIRDKTMLREAIKKIKEGSKEDNDYYLGHYFFMIFAVHNKIKDRGSILRKFTEVCNVYLEPSKRFILDDKKLEIPIKDNKNNEIKYSYLSSGEKQIVSLFTRLYLGTPSKFIVIIDEPELSLSVLWQKEFLKDIMDSKKVKYLLSATHSPFIYDNRLQDSAKDFSSFIKVNK